MDTSTEMQSFRPIILMVAGISILAVCGMLVFLNWSFASANRLSGPVELASSSDFYTKKEALQRSDALNVVLLGDSLSVGRTMAAEQPFDWKSHTLDRALETCLNKERKGKSVRVWNFALDGAVPKDFLALKNALQDAPVAHYIFNLNLRSFSKDFNEPQSQISRDWIAGLKPNPDDQSLISKFQFSKSALFDGTSKQWAARLWGDALRKWDIFSQPKRPTFSRNLMLKIKGRYRNIQTNSDAPQVQALTALLRNDHTTGFIAAENPQFVKRIIRPKVRDSLVDQLRTVVLADATDGGSDILGAPSELTKEHFLDFVHVSPKGYQIYADTICSKLNKSL